ncbi:MAG TPA: gas vesicle protein GvpJ [Actinoallomurus sp.]|nr:gas vesicle protein GvpJ [Actinoallomurus sp.]
MDRVLSDLPAPRAPVPARGQRIALVDLLDRLLAGGVVITGDVTISIADVDLVQISLRAIIASIRPEMSRMVESELVEGELVRGETVRGETVEDEPLRGVVTWEDPRS